MAATLILRKTAATVGSVSSLGGAETATEVSATALNNLFDDVSPAEALARDTEYRAVDLYNSGDATAVAVKVYLSANATAVSSIGLEGVDVGSPISIADEEDTAVALSGISFSTADGLGNAVSVADIPAAGNARLWIRRVVSSSTSNKANDGITLVWQYA